MSKRVLAAAVAVLLVVIMLQTVALWRTPPQPAGTVADRVSADTLADRLGKFGPVSDVQFDAATGLYRAMVADQIVYATPDGRYLIAGELYDLKTRENITRQARAGQRKQTLADLDPDSAITFRPEGPTRAVVWVFTDVTCPYCQKFHRHIDAYTSRGIEVRYLAYPRAGRGSDSWQLARSVWCVDDRKAAMTRAMARQDIATRDCDTQAVSRHYRAGRAMGLRGTPMIVSADGRELGGYLSPKELANRLGLGD